MKRTLNLPPAQGLSLDVDGTLYRVQIIRVAWRLRHERHLIFALMAARAKIRREPPLGHEEALHYREAELVAPSLGISIDEALEHLSRVRALLPRALTQDMQPNPGVRAALEVAAARGLRLATLSEFDPLPKVRLLGLADLPWSAHVGAYSLGGCKPHSGPFEAVCEQLQMSPAEVVHVGDREELDVHGALNAGMRAWRFARYPWMQSAAERVFSRWSLDLFTPLIAPAQQLG
ncbi:MAG: HAD family hydrolase [Myxococcales bacterium]|nr:HAD family hydrolase [Myxococcales bacterium]